MHFGYFSELWAELSCHVSSLPCHSRHPVIKLKLLTFNDSIWKTHLKSEPKHKSGNLFSNCQCLLTWWIGFYFWHWVIELLLVPQFQYSIYVEFSSVHLPNHKYLIYVLSGIPPLVLYVDTAQWKICRGARYHLCLQIKMFW